MIMIMMIMIMNFSFVQFKKSDLGFHKGLFWYISCQMVKVFNKPHLKHYLLKQ